jgi:hypothetical protein
MRPALLVFAVAAAAQWVIPLAGIWRHERVFVGGTTVRIECVPPDPYDPLRGRYLAVRPAESLAPRPAGMPEQDAVPVWATLVAGEDGISRIASLSLEPVAGPTVIRLVARRPPGERFSSSETVFIEWPFDRFYLNERLAHGADMLVAERFRAGGKTVAEVRLLDGQAILTDILLDGESIRELARQLAM